MRGEYCIEVDTEDEELGSPPHARGIRIKEIKKNGNQGITPACAGNTIRPKTLQFDSWDHPRMRGEYDRPLPEPYRKLGSPPHARGIQSR